MEKKVYNINDVADYIILRFTQNEDFSDLINLKLQKLLFYIQAWSLGIRGFRFVDAEFQAWAHGPVCRVIFDRFKDTKGLYSFLHIGDVKNPNVFALFEKEDSDFIEFILENYGGFSGVQLEEMTHNETPWIMARKGVSSLERCENVITDQSMRDYYGKRWHEVNE